jgi:HlyD family secretion protein
MKNKRIRDGFEGWASSACRIEPPSYNPGQKDARLRIRRKTKPAAIIFAVALAAASGGCGNNAPPQAAKPAPVQVAAAEHRTIQPSVTLSGIIAPLQNVALTNDVVEPVAAVYVNEGDTVTKGEVLARLSSRELQADLEAARRTAAGAEARLEEARYQSDVALESGSDQVRSAQAALGQARGNLTLALSVLNSDESLLAQGYVAEQTVEQQRAQLIVAEEGVTSAQAALATANENERANGSPNKGLQAATIDAANADYRSDVAQAAALAVQLSHATIVSPIDGIVVNRNLNVGEYPGTRTIFTLQEISSVYAELSAYGAQVAGIIPGASVAFTSPVLPEKRFSGAVVGVLPPTSPTSPGFIVKVDVPNAGRLLLPGMTVSGRVTQVPVTGVAVPVPSFLDDTHQTLMVVQGDTVHLTTVQELASDGKYSVVAGLTEGAVVVRNGDLNLTDGQKVATH